MRAAPRRPLGRRRSPRASPPRCTVAACGALRRAPGDRPVERPVELEDARAVAVALEPPAIARGQAAPASREDLPRRHVEQHGTRRRRARRASRRGARSRSRRRASAGTRRARRAIACEPPRANGQPTDVRRAARARARTPPRAAASAAASSARRARRRARARRAPEDPPRERRRRQRRPRREPREGRGMAAARRIGASRSSNERLGLRRRAAPISRR